MKKSSIMKKTYGSYREETCIFCSERAICMNEQNLPTCTKHKHELVDMNKVKCSCGDFLDIKEGKYGSFFLCMNCGPMSIAKIKEINTIKPNDFSAKQPEKTTSNSVYKSANSTTFNKTSTPSNTTIRSDDPDYFDD